MYKIDFQSKADQHEYVFIIRSCDLDPDHMTLILDFELSVLNAYLHTKNDVCTSKLSKVRAHKHRQTDSKRDKCEQTHYHAALGWGGKL